MPDQFKPAGRGAARRGSSACALLAVVLTAGGETHSLIVDSLTDVVDIPVSAIETSTIGAEGEIGECIEGVVAARDGLVHLLGIEAILAGLAEQTVERKMR